jgi:hypothetical protein
MVFTSSGNNKGNTQIPTDYKQSAGGRWCSPPVATTKATRKFLQIINNQLVVDGVHLLWQQQRQHVNSYTV